MSKNSRSTDSYTEIAQLKMEVSGAATITLSSGATVVFIPEHNLKDGPVEVTISTNNGNKTAVLKMLEDD